MQHEQIDRATAVRRLLVDTVESTKPAPRGRTAVWVATAAMGAAGAVVVSVLAVGGLGTSTGPGTDGTTVGVPGGSASRVKLYGSLDELIADSSAIVAGTVLRGEPVPGMDGYTRSTLRVDTVFSPPGLGSTAGTGPSVVAAGDEVLVRNMGGSALASTGGPSLAEGSRYLLFLTPSGLPDAPDEFYIVGAGAGTYIADGSEFRRLSTDGDTIPAAVRGADLGG